MKSRELLLIALVALTVCCLACAFTACKQTVFTINFVVDGADYAQLSTSGQEVIRMPLNPTKDGYTFDGWYWDVGTWNRPFTANSLLNEPLSADMSVYAKFSEEHIHKWSEYSWVNKYTIIMCGDCGEQTLPMINIQVNGQEITKDYADCSVWVEAGNDEYAIVGAEAEVKVRGNGTADNDKKPYRIKFKEKQKMLGLNDDLSAKSWVLLAEYSDKTLMKNATAFFLGNEILGKDGYYVSDYRFVNVFIDNVYNGMYLLAEQQQVNNGRVDITEPEKGYTGTDIGYFFELDGYAESEEYWFRISYNDMHYIDNHSVKTEDLMDKYTVKSDIYSYDQVHYIQKALQGVWNIIYDAVYNDHSAGQPFKTLDKSNNVVDDTSLFSAKEAVSKVVDVKSLVDTFIHSELCEDRDLGWSSFFMSMDFGEKGDRKLVFQAPWDFDLALGANNYKLNDLYTCTKPESFAIYTNPWLVVLANEDWFMDEVVKKWLSLKENKTVERAIDNITVYTYLYSQSISKNFVLWNECLSTEFNPHQSNEYRYATSQYEASTWLKEFLFKRAEFFDEHFSYNNQKSE